MKKKALLSFLIVGALSMIFMSSHYLYSNQSGILKRKEVASSLWYLITFRTHVLFGLFAITLGPFQYLRRIRERSKTLHRTIGYLYAISVGLSSLCGLVIAPFAMGGWIASVGFSLLGILWFMTTLKAIMSIRTGDTFKHMKWSYFSYALTFSSITQRTLLLIPLLTSVPFLPIYQLSAWLPWILNLTIARSLFRLNSKTGD